MPLADDPFPRKVLEMPLDDGLYSLRMFEMSLGNGIDARRIFQGAHEELSQIERELIACVKGISCLK